MYAAEKISDILKAGCGVWKLCLFWGDFACGVLGRVLVE